MNKRTLAIDLPGDSTDSVMRELLTRVYGYSPTADDLRQINDLVEPAVRDLQARADSFGDGQTSIEMTRVIPLETLEIRLDFAYPRRVSWWRRLVKSFKPKGGRGGGKATV